MRKGGGERCKEERKMLIKGEGKRRRGKRHDNDESTGACEGRGEKEEK